MTVTYEETKQRKLKRIKGLRVMNALGMVAWRDDGNGEAKQHLRLIHPLSWAWILGVCAFGILFQGIPDTVSDIRHCISNETVLF